MVDVQQIHHTVAVELGRCGLAAIIAGLALGVADDAVPVLDDLGARSRAHDVVAAALAAERGGADGITVHLREDRRHIQDGDVERLAGTLATKLNLEMAATDEMVAIACRVRPADVCLVDCGRGLQVLLAGVLPPRRAPLEALFFFLILKNGVPIAYGPASSFLGCCEMGINLFPEFREPSWNGWRDKVLARITPEVRELYVIAGRGAGKSRIVAVLAACFASIEHRRAPGER